MWWLLPIPVLAYVAKKLLEDDEPSGPSAAEVEQRAERKRQEALAAERRREAGEDLKAFFNKHGVRILEAQEEMKVEAHRASSKTTLPQTPLPMPILGLQGVVLKHLFNEHRSLHPDALRLERALDRLVQGDAFNEEYRASPTALAHESRIRALMKQLNAHRKAAHFLEGLVQAGDVP